MGIKEAIASVAYYGLIAVHLMHGCFQFFQPSMLMENASEQDPIGYLGDDASVHFIYFICRVAGVVEIGSSLGAIAMGPTKMCFSLMMLAHLPASLVITHDISFMREFAKDKMTVSHLRSFENAKYLMATFFVLNFAGFCAAHGKQDQGLKRADSPSAIHILLVTSLAEVLFLVAMNIDIEKTFALLLPGFRLEGVTVVGKFVLTLVCGQLASFGISALAFACILKPTTKAILIALFLQVGAGTTLLILASAIKGISSATKQTDILATVATIGVGIHAVNSLALAFAYVRAVQAPAKAKTE